MKDDINFLNYIYDNGRMGVISINNLKEYVKEEKFRELLKRQLKEYEEVCDEAIKLFVEYRSVEKDLPAMAKVMSYLSIKFSKKDSISVMAKMMIEGSNKGIIEIQEKINKYPKCDKRIIELAEHLLKTEEHNIEDLKEFL